MRLRVINPRNTLTVVTGSGIQRAPVGYEFDAEALLPKWEGMVEVVKDENPDRVAVINPAGDSLYLEREYQELTGNRPDGRWTEATLKAKVKEARDGV